MDIQTGLLCLAAFIVLVLVVWIISVFGVREKTFEEALEEQRRRKEEVLQQAKTEKPPKKEKKYKKLTKRSKEKTVFEEEFRPADPRVDFKTEAEIIPLEPETEVKPIKAKKKIKPIPSPKSILLNKQEGGLVLETTPPGEEDESEPPLLKVPKDEVERRLSLGSLVTIVPVVDLMANDRTWNGEVKGKSEEVKVAEVVPANKKKREESKSPEKDKVKKDEANVASQVPVVTPSKRNKKTTKSDSIELVDGEVSGKKLLTMVRSATLVGEEIQNMIEVLLNKQQGEAAEWTKKNDPVAGLKKQLQEKEQLLESEQKLAQSANLKLKELRQELNQEKSRFNAAERSTREKLGQQQQEITVLQSNVQRTRDQHHGEIAALQSKLQQMQQHEKNEINKLEQKISELEAEKQSRLGMEIQLQREVEQMRATLEQKEFGRSALEQERETLGQQVLQLETRVQELVSGQQQELQELECRNSSLTQELQRVKNTCNTLEGEKGSFQKRLESEEQQHRKIDEETAKLKTSLRESQSKQQEFEIQVEQQTNLIKNLENKNNDSVQQLKELKGEIERLRSQLLEASVRTAAEGQESPVHQQNGELHREEQQKKIENVEYNKIIEEKENLLMQLKDEVNNHKTQIVTLNEELESQKKKNNELREKNWKAMDAMTAVEAATNKRVKEVEERLARVQEEAKLRIAPPTDLEEIHRISEEKVHEVKKANEELVQRIQEQQEKEREVLHRLFPEIQLDSKMDQITWVQSYEKGACKLLTNLRNSSSTRQPDLSQLNGRIGELTEQNAKLEALVQHYKSVLSDTEDILKKLQSGVEAAEQDWKEKLGAKERELQKALEDKKVLETNIEELQSLEVATSEVRELEAKLKELQSKLQGEENEKKLLEQKFGEVNKNAEDLRNQIEGKKLELEELRSEKMTHEKSLLDLEKIKHDLDKEKKITKELSAHTVKLQSWVKIGQDSLQAEQELVKALQAQLDVSKVAATNGTSVTPTTTAPEIQVDSVSVPVKTDKPNKHKKRGASGKK